MPELGGGIISDGAIPPREGGRIGIILVYMLIYVVKLKGVVFSSTVSIDWVSLLEQNEKAQSLAGYLGDLLTCKKSEGKLIGPDSFPSFYFCQEWIWNKCLSWIF